MLPRIRLYLCILAICIPLTAQSDELRTFTLAQAVTQALEQNHAVKAGVHQQQAAEALARLTGTHYWPLVTLEQSLARTNTPTRTFMMKLDQGRFAQNDFQIDRLNNPRPTTDFRTSLNWEQPFFVPAAGSERTIARHQTTLARLTQEATKEEIAFRVFQTGTEIFRAKAHLQAAEQATAEARESRRLAAARVGAGAGLKSDLLRADTHLAAVDQRLLSARNQLTLARLRLGMLIGAPEGEELELLPMPPVPDQPPSLAVLLDDAHQRRLELRRGRTAREQAASTHDAALSAYLPSVAGFAGYQLNDHRNPFNPEHDSWLAGINLRWNLFDGFRREHRLQATRAQQAAAEHSLELLRRETDLQIRASLLQRQEADKRRQTALTAVTAAEEAVRLLSRRYEHALATMADLLDAQTALNQARADLADSEAERQLSTARIWQTSGILLQEVQK